MPSQDQPETSDPQSADPFEAGRPDEGGAPRVADAGRPQEAPTEAPPVAVLGQSAATETDAAPDARELPMEEAVRQLREQMADPDWDAREHHLVLQLTVAEDPTAAHHLQLAFGPLRHPERIRGAWRRAQALVDASPDGRILGARVELLPGGGRWHAWLHSPVLFGGFLVSPRDFRTPLAALRHVARAYLAAVVEDGARVLVARGRRQAEAEQEPATEQDTQPEEPTHD